MHVIVSSLSKGHLAGDEWMDLSRLLVGKKLITVNDKVTYFGILVGKIVIEKMA